MNWNEIGRFVVGSYLWDKFYPNDPNNTAPPSTLDKGLAAIRLIVIAVLAFVVYRFFSSMSRKR